MGRWPAFLRYLLLSVDPITSACRIRRPWVGVPRFPSIEAISAVSSRKQMPGPNLISIQTKFTVQDNYLPKGLLTAFCHASSIL